MGNRVVQTTLIIEGMHCNSCELRVEQELTKIPGVVKAQADYVKSRLELTYDPVQVDCKQIADCIERLDYRIKGGTKDDSSNPVSGRSGAMSFSQLLGIAIMVLAAYLVINNTVGFSFVPQISQKMGYGLLFVVGLITSVHCVAMCGGINISQCIGNQFEETRADKTQQLMPSLKYNLGRVISYSVLGG
ncbi:MAG: sulfite exporter TauE/SafE family protein, partial [Bacillota bacterium]